MDVCCLNRPYDDLSQNRVYLEAEAVLVIIANCEAGEWTLLKSSIIDAELSLTPDQHKLQQVRSLYSVSSEICTMSGEVSTRSQELVFLGYEPFDSRHIAMAEHVKADIFLTVDDAILRRSKRVDLQVRVENPINWLMEVLSDEQ